MADRRAAQRQQAERLRLQEEANVANGCYWQETSVKRGGVNHLMFEHCRFGMRNHLPAS